MIDVNVFYVVGWIIGWIVSSSVIYHGNFISVSFSFESVFII
jgi:hypothetical protein